MKSIKWGKALKQFKNARYIIMWAANDSNESNTSTIHRQRLVSKRIRYVLQRKIVHYLSIFIVWKKGECFLWFLCKSSFSICLLLLFSFVKNIRIVIDYEIVLFKILSKRSIKHYRALKCTTIIDNDVLDIFNEQQNYDEKNVCSPHMYFIHNLCDVNEETEENMRTLTIQI